MKTTCLATTLTTSFCLLLVMPGTSPSCSADQIYFDGDVSDDFNTAANWSDNMLPSLDIDIHIIQDGLTATYSGGSTSIRGLIVGDQSFGRLTMTGGALEILDKNVLEVGRERFPSPVGGDYNNNAVVDAADYVIWRDTLGSETDFRADGDTNAIVDQADYDFWRARFGNLVKGGEIIMAGSSTLTADGAIIGRRTNGLLSIGPTALVDIRGVDGAEDLRVGSYGPAYETFGAEPGLEANGLIIVEGTLNAKELQLNEHGATGELRIAGGTVNLTGALVMSVCDMNAPDCGLVTDPDLLAGMSSTVSLIGSGGAFNVGLDPDPTTVDPMPPNRDIRSDFPATATFSFTADAGGVTSITVADNGAELSGTAIIDGTKLELNLDAYTSTAPLTLIDAPPGQLSGTFGTVTFLGNTTATVNYDVANGNVFLDNFQRLGAATSLVGSAVPEPSGLAIMALALGGTLVLTSCRIVRLRRHGILLGPVRRRSMFVPDPR